MRDMNVIIGNLGGKKFLAAVVGVLVIVVSHKMGLSVSAASEIVSLLMTYIFGQSIADGWSGGATSSVAASTADTRARAAEAELRAFREMREMNK